MGAQRTYPVCASCKCEVKNVGTVLIGQCEDTEEIKLCITCLANKLTAATDLLHPDEARAWLTQI